MRIVIEDGGSARSPSAQPSASRPSSAASFAPGFSSPRPPTPAAPPAPRFDPLPIHEMIKEVLAAGKGGSLKGMTFEEMAKLPPAFVEQMYEKIAKPIHAAGDDMRGAMADAVSAAKDIGDSFKKTAGDLAGLTEGFGLKPPSFDWSQYGKKFGQTGAPDQPAGKFDWNAIGAPANGGSPIKPFGMTPTATPVTKLPVAQPVYDFDKSRAKWTPGGMMDDLKSWLPAGIGGKLGEVKDAYAAGSRAAGQAGAGAVGRAAGGIGEAAVAAGPAIVVTAALLAQQKMVDMTNKAAAAVEGLGNQAGRFASNDHLGMFNAAVDGTKEALEEIPVYGKKWAAELGLAAAPVRAFTTAVNGFVARARELEGLSGPIARAGAVADIRSLRADLKEADQLGPALARLTDVQSRVDTELRDMLLPIKEFVVRGLATGLEQGLAAWEFVKPILARMGQNIFDILDTLEKLVEGGALGDAMADLAKAIRKGHELDEQLRQIQQQDAGPIVDWLNAADGLGGAFVPGAADPAARARAKLAGPIFPGFEKQTGM